MWPMGLLFIKTSPVKQYSSENDFSGVFDAWHQNFLGVYMYLCGSERTATYGVPLVRYMPACLTEWTYDFICTRKQKF